jgi:hypothetical protein
MYKNNKTVNILESPSRLVASDLVTGKKFIYRKES